MTDLQLAKAAKVLLNKRGILGDDRYLPKLWMVGDEVCVFYNAAKRHQENMLVLYNQYYDIEEVTIEKAYEFLYHKPINPFKLRKVVKDFDQSGGLGHDEKFNIAKRMTSDPRIQIKITD